MKKFFIAIALMASGMVANAQVTVTEPEFVGTYYHLTSDSTFAVLPKENGTVKKHENKVSKWAKLAKGASSLAGAAGLVGIGTGSVSGMMTGARVMTTASGIGDVASTVSTLAGIRGMDIVFQGRSSSYSVAIDGDLRFIIRAEDNNTNPVDIYRIVRLNTSKKERRVQWFEYSSTLLGSSEAEKNGYVSFKGKRFGESSYLISIPASQLKPGQYAIFLTNVESALAIPVATFGVADNK